MGKTFRTTVYGDTDMYTVVGVYKKEMSAFQKLLSGGSARYGDHAYIPYTLLTWPNDQFYYCRLYAKRGNGHGKFHVKADGVSRENQE